MCTPSFFIVNRLHSSSKRYVISKEVADTEALCPVIFSVIVGKTGPLLYIVSLVRSVWSVG